MEPKKGKKHENKKSRHNSNGGSNRILIYLIVVAAALLVFNQVQILSLASAVKGSGSHRGSGGGDIGNIDITQIKSTAQTLAAVFPLDEAQTSDDVMNMIFPTGTPDYGEDLGVSFDDPINSLSTLAKMYRPLKDEVKSSNPEAFQRFVNLASSPLGISCEFCCGVGPAGADKNGNPRCGCQHNPALLSVALYLSAYTDYTDGEILREVMKWKTLFFPKNMIDLGSKIAGGDSSVLENLPGMVGGC